MATTFTKADDATRRFILGVMKFYHPEAARVDVTLDILLASNPDGPAVKYGGYPVAAKFKINNLEQRAKGAADATLIIDDSYWNNASKPERTALIDGEITHIELKRLKPEKIPEGQSDNIKRDDVGRPLFKIRKFDFNVGGFLEVVERHGAKYVSAQNVAVVKERFEQMEFPWAEAETLAARGSQEAATELAGV